MKRLSYLRDREKVIIQYLRINALSGKGPLNGIWRLRLPTKRCSATKHSERIRER